MSICPAPLSPVARNAGTAVRGPLPVPPPRVDTKSSNWRCRAGHPGVREEGVPDQLCLSKANDRDFEAQLRALGGRQAAEAAAPGVTVACHLKKIVLRYMLTGSGYFDQ